MGRQTTITLQASDGVHLSAYLSEPAGAPKGGIVVLQELFGVNRHIRSLCDDFAAQDYAALAPALFDRLEPGLELGYDEQSIKAGFEARAKIPLADVLADVQAAIDRLRGYGRVGVVGYCWGGTLAFLAAARLEGLSAAVGYYGSMIPDYRDEAPKVPLMLHFGETDHTLPREKVEQVSTARPDARIFVYHAGHGFSCTERSSFEPQSAAIARARTLEFFDEEVAS